MRKPNGERADGRWRGRLGLGRPDAHSLSPLPTPTHAGRGRLQEAGGRPGRRLRRLLRDGESPEATAAAAGARKEERGKVEDGRTLSSHRSPLPPSPQPLPQVRAATLIPVNRPPAHHPGEEGEGGGGRPRARRHPLPPILAADGGPARWWSSSAGEGAGEGSEPPPLPARRAGWLGAGGLRGFSA